MVRRKKAPPKPSARYVNWALMAYLKRYTAPRSHVRRVLWRKLERCLSHHDGDRDEVSTWIEQALDQAVSSGLIDDERYIRDKVRSYLRRGTSTMGITQKLYGKGVSRDQVNAVIAELRESGMDPQWIALASYVRRVRMGPFRTQVTDPREQRQKDLAKLGRAGFSFDQSSKMLALDLEEIEEFAFQRRFI